MKKGISIIVCTFNGASRLAETIRHLAAQTVDQSIGWEVIFVDNASTDNSTQVVLDAWAEYGPENIALTTLKEERPGKIFALEQAFATARYEYAIICDDDNWLDHGYAQLVCEILEHDEKIGATGGQSTAINDSGTFPVWFKTFEDRYAVGQQAPETGDVTSRGYLWGAGMGTRTKVYRAMYKGFPSLLTGRKGETLAAGEDTEYCQRLVLRGFRLHYDSRLFFNHYIPQNRLSETYKDKLFQGMKDSEDILSIYFSATIYLRTGQHHLNRRLSFILTKLVKAIFTTSSQKRKKSISALEFAISRPVNSNSTMAKIIRFYKQQPQRGEN